MSPRKRRRFPRAGDPTYAGAHSALYAERGKADQHLCVDCGGPATDWSYDNSDPREFTDPATGCAYSPDTSRYQPKCRSCHRRADWAHRRRDRPPLDIEHIRQLYEDGCSAKGIGKIFGYTAVDVLTELRAAGVEIRKPGQNRYWLRAQQIKRQRQTILNSPDS